MPTATTGYGAGMARTADGSTDGSYVNKGGEFTRDQRYIATRITADGRDGYPVEPERYRLVVRP
jgi:glutathionyl-hydroquinone reductase